MISPSWSLAEVFALNALQKSMMLTPCWPSAGPTGGAGVAFPAGICNLSLPITFFAICSSLASNPGSRVISYNDRGYRSLRGDTTLTLFHLQKVKFHRRRTSEDRHHDF